MAFEAVAPAKINLFLHVNGRRADGYHDLTSLIAFADFGDHLTLHPDTIFSLEVEGRFAAQSGDIEHNLVKKAAHLFQKTFPYAKTGAFHLIKNIPVAAGLGGGSADAAAALKLLAQANSVPIDAPELYAIAAQCGADVPACLNSKSALMQGIGDVVTNMKLPKLNAVLVNNGAALSTKDVFTAFSPHAHLHPPVNSIPQDFDECVAWLSSMRNDLDAAAQSLCPSLVETAKALHATNAALVRMSGSGATLFGLYDSAACAAKAAANLQALQPRWFVQQAVLN